MGHPPLAQSSRGDRAWPGSDLPPFIMGLKSVQFSNHNFNLEIRDNIDESVMAEIFKWREYRCADTIVKKAKVIIDVGAHSGLFSIYCRGFNYKAKIFALEPEPENFKILKQNIKRNKISGIVLSQSALAGETGRRDLLVAADNHNHRLLSPDEKPAIDKKITVQAVSLNDYCRDKKIVKADLIKIDIEGGEYELIASWNRNDYSLINALVLEYHSPVANHYKILEKTLRENGFSVEIFPSRFDRTMGFMLARNKKIAS